MSNPIIDVYMFEDAMEKAVAAHYLANGINDPKKQQDNDALLTPRVELKALWNGWGQTPSAPHMWHHSTHGNFPDTGSGKVFAKCVTRRGGDQNHARLRGTIRSLMQSCSALTARMSFHQVEKMFESGTMLDFGQDQNHDVSTLSFDFVLRILFDTKTTQIFPT